MEKFKIVRKKWLGNSNEQNVLFIKKEFVDKIKEKFNTKPSRGDKYLVIDKDWYGKNKYHPWTLELKLNQVFDDEYYGFFGHCGDYSFGCSPWYYKKSLTKSHIVKSNVIYKNFLCELFGDDVFDETKMEK